LPGARHARILDRVIARISVGIALLVAGAASAAEPPLPGGLPDLVGPRSLALGASIGIAHANEGVFVNVASLAARKRYSIETAGYVDRRGAENVARLYGGSVVDSVSAAVAGAFSYMKADEGPYTGNAWWAALAGELTTGLYVGVGGKYLDFEGPDPTSAATVDAGLFWQIADYVSLGAAGYNLVSIANDAVAPMGYGAGVGLGSDRSFQLTADWRADLDRAGKTTNRFAAGAEVLLGEAVPLRAGWMRDETLGGSWWSIGAGIVTRQGVALDFAYRQSFDDLSARTIAASIKVFLFQ
jgi:hypothetical protein